MENVIFNELLIRGYSVDVGVVAATSKDGNGYKRSPLEVDFVANRGSRRIYIQSAYSVAEAQKMEQEQQSFLRIRDSFTKVIIQRNFCKPWQTDSGVLVICLEDFLLKADMLENHLY